MSFRAGHDGEDVRNDCWVELTPGSGALRIESSVGPIYGRQIEATVQRSIERLGLSAMNVHVVDSGAFGWCLEARIEAAARKWNPDLSLPRMTRRGPPPHSGHRPRRTRLYLPGNTPKFFINAALHGADAVILDLEDAVPEPEKDEARILVRHALHAVDFGTCERMVRVNRGTHQSADLAIAEAGADTLLLPKVESAEEIEALGTKLPIVALIESAKGISRADEIAGAPGVVALAIGVEDYLADIGASREGLAFAYSQVVNAACARGIQPLASVWSDIDDGEGLEEETKRLVSLGFEGVGCLHPSQIVPAARAFVPPEQDLARARRVVEAFDAQGGAVSVDGKMVDAPVAARARRQLAHGTTSIPNWRIG